MLLWDQPKCERGGTGKVLLAGLMDAAAAAVLIRAGQTIPSEEFIKELKAVKMALLSTLGWLWSSTQSDDTV